MILPTHIVAVGGWIKRHDGKILLVKHPRRGWEFPGGQVEVGETLPQALKREIFEESGVEVEIKRLVGIHSNISVRKGYNGVETIPTIVNMTFICAYVSGELQVSNEHLDIGWFTENEAVSMVTEPLIADRVNNLINFNGDICYDAFNAEREYVERMIL